MAWRYCQEFCCQEFVNHFEMTCDIFLGILVFFFFFDTHKSSWDTYNINICFVLCCSIFPRGFLYASWFCLFFPPTLNFQIVHLEALRLFHLFHLFYCLYLLFHFKNQLVCFQFKDFFMIYIIAISFRILHPSVFIKLHSISLKMIFYHLPRGFESFNL